MRSWREAWAWLACAIVLELRHGAVVHWHFDPFSPSKCMQVVSELYDVWFDL